MTQSETKLGKQIEKQNRRRNPFPGMSAAGNVRHALVILTLVCGSLLSQAGPAADTANTQPPVFTAAPLDLDQIVAIIPLGYLDPHGGHVFPSDHIYFDYGGKGGLAVLAPAPGNIYAIRDQLHGGSKIEVRVNKNLNYYLAHLQIEAGIRVGIQVKAGQLLGRVSGESMLDLGANDGRIRLPGIVSRDRYPEPTLHALCPLALFAEPWKDRLRAKVAREGDDKYGKIDFDRPGKLVGNWFHESLGPGESSRTGPDIWARQLAFVYDVGQPKAPRISIGGTVAPVGVYALIPAAPDPATVSPQTGFVKLRLRPTVRTGPGWSAATSGSSATNNTLCVQLLADNKLKVEYFPGKVAADITDVTPAASIYTR